MKNMSKKSCFYIFIYHSYTLCVISLFSYKENVGMIKKLILSFKIKIIDKKII